MTPTDPLYASQWHFYDLISGFLIGDIETIWDDYSGAGIQIGVYDSSVDYAHADLNDNYNDDPVTNLHFESSAGDVYDPQITPIETNNHGTAVMGIIGAEANNGIGGVGVAHGATLTGVNFTGEIVPSLDQALILEAIHWGANFDVINNSWGLAPNDPATGELINYDQVGMTETTGEIWQWMEAYEDIVEVGRDGLGTNIVQAAGNGGFTAAGLIFDALNANSDGINSSRYVISVAATDQNGFVQSYSNWGTSILVSAPAASVTTDLSGRQGDTSGDYTEAFGGTSAAAPLVTGTIALMLEANPELGWRDVQNILSISAAQTGSIYGTAGTFPERTTWGVNDGDTWNGGGATYNLSYGYGMVDVYAATRMAEAWSLFYDTPMTSGDQAAKDTAGLTYSTVNEVKASGTYAGPDVAIPDLGTTSDVDPNALTITITDDITIETVYVTVNVTHSWGGDLVMWLISPQGEETPFFINESSGYQIGDVKDNSGVIFPNDDRMDAGFEWTFEVGVLRGASSEGDWQLRIDDTISDDVGVVTGFSMEFFGSPETDDDVYHFTDDFLEVAYIDGYRTTINGDGVDRNDDTTIDDSIDWMNLVAVSGDVTLDLSATEDNLSVDQTGSGGTNEVWATIITGSMENVAAGDGNDTITGDGETNHIHGGRGNDVLQSLGGHDFIFGGLGEDLINAGSGNDTINGGDGNDQMSGRNGNDYLTGGAGIDHFIFTDTAEGFDVISDFTQGEDVIDLRLAGIATVSDLSPTIISGDTILTYGTSQITLSNFTGTLVADDFVFIGTGTDGDDYLEGNRNPNTFDGLAGNDRILGKGGNDTLFGGTDNDKLFGGRGDDQLLGEEGDDILNGGHDDDVLGGGAGNDVLLGLHGNDALSGGTGNDTFVFKTTGYTDTITDFVQGEDVIKLKSLGITNVSEVTQVNAGTDLVLTFLENTIILEGLAGASFTDDDFVFA